ncbi:hypothetical protein Tco_0833290 [Tanacetum coccineum]
MLNLRNSNQYPPIDLYDLKGSGEGDNEIDSLTMEPSDTFLIGDKVCDDLECDVPITIPLPTTDVREEDFDINSPLGEQVVDFLMENEDVAGSPTQSGGTMRFSSYANTPSYCILTYGGGVLLLPSSPHIGSYFIVTPLSDSNEDEFFTPRDDIELLLHHDPSISIVSILEGFIDEPPLEENDDLFDLESKEND